MKGGCLRYFIVAIEKDILIKISDGGLGGGGSERWCSVHHLMLILGASCLELILGARLTQIKICQIYRLKRKALLSTVTYSNPQKARLSASLKGVLLACSLPVGNSESEYVLPNSETKLDTGNRSLHFSTHAQLLVTGCLIFSTYENREC